MVSHGFLFTSGVLRMNTKYQPLISKVIKQSLLFFERAKSSPTFRGSAFASERHCCAYLKKSSLNCHEMEPLNFFLCKTARSLQLLMRVIFLLSSNFNKLMTSSSCCFCPTQKPLVSFLLLFTFRFFKKVGYSP